MELETNNKISMVVLILVLQSLIGVFLRNHFFIQSVDRNVTVGKVIWGKDEKTNVGVACYVCV